MTFLEIFAGSLAVVAGKQFYGDALRPGAKEIGKAGAAAVRAIRAAGIGPEQAVELRDDLIAFVGRAVRRVPEANRVEPAPQILGPILEQLRYEPIDTPVAEMLEAILARSMDKARVFEAHPVFVQIVRGLVADEVRLLRRLAQGPLVTSWARLPDEPAFTVPELPPGLLESPDAFPLYRIHLEAQRLCVSAYRDKNGYAVRTPLRPVGQTEQHRLELRLDTFGEALMKAADLSAPPSPAADNTERVSPAP